MPIVSTRVCRCNIFCKILLEDCEKAYLRKNNNCPLKEKKYKKNKGE